MVMKGIDTKKTGVPPKFLCKANTRVSEAKQNLK